MTFLAPMFLAAGAAASLVIIALHLLARQRPRAAPLPTARFVPDRPARAASRAPLPTDLVLLLVRILAVMLLAAAMSQPERTPARRAIARVVLADVSASAGSRDSVVAAAQRLLAPGDRLIAFDSVPHALGAVPADTLLRLPVSGSPGDLAAALLAGLREARLLARQSDSVQLAVISPLSREEWTAAVAPIRAQWPGRIAVARVPAAVAESSGAVTLRASADDPLSATVQLAGQRAVGDGAGQPVMLVRDSLRAADSAAARAGAVVVYWPRIVPAAATTRSALVTDSTVAVLPLTGWDVPDGRAVARWADGTPAASEKPLGRGCLRTVDVGVPAAGDAVLELPLRRVVRTLVRPCGPPRAPDTEPASVMQLAGTGPLASARALGRLAPDANRWAPWLLGAALLLLLGELALRSRLELET